MKKLSNAGKKALLYKKSVYALIESCVILLREERCHCCQEGIMALQNNIMQVKKSFLVASRPLLNVAAKSVILRMCMKSEYIWQGK